ncbi:MAG: hypothetical protein R3313_05070 [Candidatus Saccharimonadales bacterium]|nr:hypothetical protein [Candidatus Saccharimonadales bacterium]
MPANPQPPQGPTDASDQWWVGLDQKSEGDGSEEEALSRWWVEAAESRKPAEPEITEPTTKWWEEAAKASGNSPDHRSPRRGPIQLSELAVVTALENDDPTLPRIPLDVMADQRVGELFARLRNEPEHGNHPLKEMIRPTRGWKIHLNFDAEKHSDVVRESLDEIIEGFETASHEPIIFKIGHGGGKEAGAPGKESTVYVGTLVDTIKLADRINSHPRLAPVLLPPGYDVIADDVPIGGPDSMIWARFEVLGLGSAVKEAGFGKILQYGKAGAPGYEEFIKWPLENQDLVERYMQGVERTIQAFGEGFTGPNGEYFDLVEDASEYLSALAEADE